MWCNLHQTMTQRWIGSHKVDVALQLEPERGGGFGGAIQTWTIKIDVDGKRRVDSLFGHVHYLDINIQRIQIYPTAPGQPIKVTVQEENNLSIHFVKLEKNEAWETEETIHDLMTEPNDLLPSQMIDH